MDEEVPGTVPVAENNSMCRLALYIEIVNCHAMGMAVNQ
jgi:hypothetical protein